MYPDPLHPYDGDSPDLVAEGCRDLDGLTIFTRLWLNPVRCEICVQEPDGIVRFYRGVLDEVTPEPEPLENA